MERTELLTQQADPNRTPLPPQFDRGVPRVRGYDIFGVVGRGGMGLVYEARHRELNRRVALKTLRGEALADPVYRERFRHEAEAIAQLQHPNIIQVYEVGATEPGPGATEGEPFIALEFVDGGSLAQRARGPQTADFVARILEPVARAAHAAHELGIVHRDLKPSNVLLARDGTPKVADFGIAKQMGQDARSVTRIGTVMGTPEYMAPEQFDGETAVPSIDIYSLGVMLYEMLTGRVPLQGATFADTMLLVIQQDPVPPSQLQPGVPRDLETVCLKCLEKDPRKRYRTAEELANDLARWRAGEPILARPLGPVGRAVRWARRKPTIAALVALVVLVSAIGAAVGFWQWDDARANARVADENAREARKSADRAENETRAARSAESEALYERNLMYSLAAATALRVHDSNSARSLLKGVPETARDWGWHVMNSRLDRAACTVSFEGAARARLTPDGGHALAEGLDGRLRVWNADDNEVRDVPLTVVSQYAVLAPDGSMIAVVPKDSRGAVLVDLTGRVRTKLAAHTAALERIWFTPDGRRVMTGSCTDVVVWDVATGRELGRATDPLSCAAPRGVSCDLSRVAFQHADNGHSILDTSTGRTVSTLAPSKFPPTVFEFSPEGDRVISGEGLPVNVLRLHDTATGRVLAELSGHENDVRLANFSPDGTRLVSVSFDRTARVWDVTRDGPGNGRRDIVVFRGHTAWVTGAQFTPDNKKIISGGFDRTVRVWDAHNGDQLAVLLGHDTVTDFARSRPDGGLVSLSSDCVLKCWSPHEVRGGGAFRGHNRFLYGTAFLPDGRRVVSCAWDGTARVWNADTGAELGRMEHGRARAVAALAVSPDGRTLATYARDDTNDGTNPDSGVRLWDVETQKLLHFWPLTGLGWLDSRLAFSPDGTKLASGTSGGPIMVWDVRTKAEVRRFSLQHWGSRGLAFSPDSTKLAVGFEQPKSVVRVWNVNTGELLHELDGHIASVNGVRWNPTGTVIASCAGDGTARLWNADTGTPIGDSMKHGRDVYGLDFHRDGTILATACADGVVRLWSTQNQRLTAELPGHTNYAYDVSFSPDGTRLASASGDKTLRIWDTVKPSDRTRK